MFTTQNPLRNHSQSLLQKRFLMLEAEENATFYKIANDRVICDESGKPVQIPTKKEIAEQCQSIQDQVKPINDVFTVGKAKQESIRSALDSALGKDLVISTVLEEMHKDIQETSPAVVNPELIASKEELLKALQGQAEAYKGHEGQINSQREEQQKLEKMITEVIKKIITDSARLEREDEEDERSRKALEGGLSGVSEVAARFKRKRKGQEKAPEKASTESLIKVRLDENKKRNDLSQEAYSQITAELQTWIQIDEKKMKELLGSDISLLESNLSKLTEASQKTSILNRLKGELSQKIQGVTVTIDTLKKEIETLKGNHSSTRQSRENREKRLEENRKKLEKAQASWQELTAILTPMIDTRSQIEALKIGMDKMSEARETVKISQTMFDALADDLQGFNTEFCESILGLYSKSRTVLEDQVTKLTKSQFKIDQLEIEKAFLEQVQMRKSIKMNTKGVSDDPQKSIQEYFYPFEDFVYDQFFKQLHEIIQKLEHVAKEKVEKEVHQSNIDIELNKCKLQIEEFQSGVLEASSRDYDGWLEEQVTAENKADKTLLSPEQSLVFEDSLISIDDQAVEDGLFPILSMILPKSELQKLQELSPGNKISLKINHVGIEKEKIFTFSVSTSTPNMSDQEKESGEVQRSYQINGRLPHLELTGSSERLMGILKHFFISLENGKAETENWSFSLT